MATLEKIRQRKKILAIVIGAALLAFIIEVGVEAIGRSGGNSAVAKIGSEKIDIMTYQHRVEKEAALAQNDESQKDVDGSIRQQQVLDEMISEKLFQQEYEKLGIVVSDNEISELMVGKNPAPAVVQFCQQTGAQSPAEFYDFLMNPGKQGVQEAQVAELRAKWQEMQDNITKEYQSAKLMMLVAGCMQANDLDRKAMEEEDANTNVLLFAKKDYASLDDKDFPVTDEELKAEWEKLKPMFKIEEPARMIHYIAVNIEPSAEDIAMADKLAAEAWNKLQVGTGVEAVRQLGWVMVDTGMYTAKELPASVKDFFLNANVGATTRDTAAYVKSQNKYTMYKLINKMVSLDSVDMGYVIVQGDAKVQKDVLAQLNSGKSLDDVKKAFPQKVDGKLNSWNRVFASPDSIKNKVANATIGEYFVFNSNEQGAQLVKVNERKPAKTFYTLGVVNHEAYASTKTSEATLDKFQAYLNKNKTVKAFEDNAAKNGYNAAEMLIGPSTAQLGLNQFGQGGIKDSRKAVKWAFDSKKGDVSPIFSDNKDVLLAVAIDEIYEGDYLPWNFAEGRKILEQRVRNRKKGEALVKQYTGKATDIQGYAAAMGCQVDTTSVVFSTNGNPKIGNETGLLGRMSVAKTGKVMGPWAGKDGVYVYQAIKQEKAERKATKEELDRRYAQSRGASLFASRQAINGILSKATKVKKSLIDFY